MSAASRWKLSPGAVAALVSLVIVTASVLLVRLAFSAYHEERDHAEFLFDCCHHQTPEECENVWLSQYAVRPDE